MSDKTKTEPQFHSGRRAGARARVRCLASTASVHILH